MGRRGQRRAAVAVVPDAGRGTRRRPAPGRAFGSSQLPAGAIRSADAGRVWLGIRREETDDTAKRESGTYALDALEEQETIARLATGIKRFRLPEEHNFIRIYQQVAAEGKDSLRVQALAQLGSIFENRRQYARAAEYWVQAIAATNSERQRGQFQSRLNQIRGNWGRFEPIAPQPAGRGASAEFRFRNGKAVQFTAHAIRVDKLLGDVKAYLKSRPNQLRWEQVNIRELGQRLISENQTQYRGAEVARWRLELQPREKHFDRRITVTTPLQKAGAYLLTAEMAGGNTSHVVVWVADTVIVKKTLDGKTLYYVADAVDGRPVARANVEFFGFRQEHREGRNYELLWKQFSEFSNAEGQVILGPDRQPHDYQWVMIASTAEGRLAYLGFTQVSPEARHDPEYSATKIYTITDRPVYRPAQTVHYKLWVRHAKYDQADVSDFAGQAFALEIRNPKGERLVEKQVKADAYGGIEGKLDLPADAMLGVYRVGIVDQGGGQFRVEEYKKPEFEVSVAAPEEPVMLGEKIQATIEAKYYFGSPVTEAKVKYKIERTAHSERWYPVGPWDWLFGRGYWWFAYDYAWYPGWSVWGCARPRPFWWPVAHEPPELVVDREVEIGPDGKVKVEIDTALAKEIHGDEDHQYTITAEVVDRSRRTIVGTGTVLVARKPFAVTTWLDRGYYRVGDVIEARAAGHRLDGKPVKGRGELAVLAVRYVDGKPVEQPIFARTGHRRRGTGADAAPRVAGGAVSPCVQAYGRPGAHDRRGLSLYGDGRGFRQRPVPLQLDRDRSRQGGISAGREGAACDQHGSAGQQRAVVPAADQRRLPAAQAGSPRGQEHDLRDRGRAARHAELFR